MVGANDIPAERDSGVRALFVAHYGRLVALARLLVDDVPTAEDVVQDAFAALYRRWPWLRDHGASLAYLQTAVVNGARSQLRHRHVERGVTFDAREEYAPSPEVAAVDHERKNELLCSLAHLPYRQRQVLVLRYFLDLSEAEIADRLDISRGSVKKHASRAIASLSAELEPVQ